jgi:hypothetical protein
MPRLSAVVAWTLAGLAAGLTLLCGPGRAQATPIFVPGSSFTVTGTNAPGSFTDTAYIKAGTQSLDDGALDLTVSVVAASRGAEWIVFDFSVPSGTLSQPSENFDLSITGVQLARAATNTQTYVEFAGSSGVLAPTYSPLFKIPVENDPVPGKTGSGVDLPGTGSDPAGPVSMNPMILTPFSGTELFGINPADVTGIEEAALFTVPEPLPLGVLSAGLLALALTRRRA